MINNIKKLNPLVLKDPKTLVLRVEEEYHNRIRKIAEEIKSREEIRLVLLAGPSASGKTTSSKLLRKYLSEMGVKTETLSLDDYYKSHEDMPRDEYGMLDFESVYSLETDEIITDLSALSKGAQIEVPIFSFPKKCREEHRRKIDSRDGIVIVEGLHALNPVIISHIDKAHILKLYVSVVAGFEDESEMKLESRDIRLLRRMSRDILYRDSSLENSLNLWSSVIRGEDKYLCPLRHTADIEICSFHDYELALFKGIMHQKLKELPESVPNYLSVLKILHFMEGSEILSPLYIPSDSLMREFIS